MDEGGGNMQETSWGKRLGWGAAMTLLVVWAFVLGILVGQGSILPPEHLQYIQGFLGLDGQPQAEAEPQTPPQKAEMSFYRGTKDEAPAKKALKPPAKPKPTDKPKDKPKEKPEAEEKTAGNEKAPAKDAAAAPGEVKGWIVQAASLKEQALALKMVRDMKKSGFPAYVLRSQVKKIGLRFRVRVGPYKTRQIASQVAARIKSKYKHAALVMREE